LPQLAAPVRILAGAFGPNLPQRDLRVSPCHGIYQNGHLFEAASLINGSTIFQEQFTTSVTYYHIELEAHDILLAEGLAAESYLETGNRYHFEGENAISLHADFRAPGDAQFCVPLIRAGETLETLRAHLGARCTAVAV
jgi:serralysin